MVAKQFKFISSVTLSVLVLLFGFGYPADTFGEFKVEVAMPYADSVSVYNLTFSLSNESYRRLNKAQLILGFPQGFGLESVDSIYFSSDHPSRKYGIDRVSIENETELIIRLDRIQGGSSESDGERINISVGIHQVLNASDTGEFQINGTIRKGESEIAGPSWSEFFRIDRFVVDTGRGFDESFIVEDNPFNPNDGPVRFVYNLSGASDVEFNIFTVTGEEVYSHTYLSGSEGGNSGTNKIQWDGKNSEGEMVLNGVYVTMLNVLSTGEKASLKLAVLK